MDMEEGKIYTAMLFYYPDGFVFRWTPGGLPVQVISNVRFDLDGKRDEFGVPPHAHEDAQLSEATNLEGSIDFLVENAKAHGPPQAMGLMLFKKVGRYVVQLFGSPPSLYGGPEGYVVSALAAQEVDPTMTTEKLFELGKAGASLPVAEHDHWFASERPMPFSAALWIFRSVTEENIVATNCNCEPAIRPRHRGVQPFPMPDERFVGEE